MILLNLIITSILTFTFIKLIIKNAKILDLVDIPIERSVHTKITPRGAGIGVGLASLLTILIFDNSLFMEHWPIFLAIFIVFAVGMLDDRKDVTPKTKFYAIFIATFILYAEGVSIDSLGVFWGMELSLGYFALPFTMFALAGFTNALNLIDGLDGLAGSIALVILSAFLYIGCQYDDALMMTLCMITMVAIMAFLLFNWYPAKIFMGDSGSLFLGFVISVIATMSLKYIHPVAVLYLAALPIMDTLIVMVRRMRRGMSPFTPDKTHMHHILLNFFSKNVKKTVYFLVLMQTLFSLAGLFLADDSKILPRGLALGSFGTFVGINMIFYMIFTGMKRKQKLIEKLAYRRNKERY